MAKKDYDELHERSAWEDDGEVREPVKAARAVVSVAFARDDFERVVDHAQRAGMKTSEFIRASVLRSLDAPTRSVRIVSVAGLAHNDYPTNRTLTMRERGMSLTGNAMKPNALVSTY